MTPVYRLPLPPAHTTSAVCCQPATPRFTLVIRFLTHTSDFSSLPPPPLVLPLARVVGINLVARPRWNDAVLIRAVISPHHRFDVK